MPTDFNNTKIFDETSLSDLFKQIHKKNKSVDKQITEILDLLKPLATKDAGSAVMLIRNVTELLDVNVKNNEQLIKMAGIVQRASSNSGNEGDERLIDFQEIQMLVEEQKSIEGNTVNLISNIDVPKIENKNENKG